MREDRLNLSTGGDRTNKKLVHLLRRTKERVKSWFTGATVTEVRVDFVRTPDADGVMKCVTSLVKNVLDWPPDACTPAAIAWRSPWLS